MTSPYNNWYQSGFRPEAKSKSVIQEKLEAEAAVQIANQRKNDAQSGIKASQMLFSRTNAGGKNDGHENNQAIDRPRQIKPPPGPIPTFEELGRKAAKPDDPVSTAGSGREAHPKSSAFKALQDAQRFGQQFHQRGGSNSAKQGFRGSSTLRQEVSNMERSDNSSSCQNHDQKHVNRSRDITSGNTAQDPYNQFEEPPQTQANPNATSRKRKQATVRSEEEEEEGGGRDDREIEKKRQYVEQRLQHDVGPQGSSRVDHSAVPPIEEVGQKNKNSPQIQTRQQENQTPMKNQNNQSEEEKIYKFLHSVHPADPGQEPSLVEMLGILCAWYNRMLGQKAGNKDKAQKIEELIKVNKETEEKLEEVRKRELESKDKILVNLQNCDKIFFMWNNHREKYSETVKKFNGTISETMRELKPLQVFLHDKKTGIESLKETLSHLKSEVRVLKQVDADVNKAQEEASVSTARAQALEVASAEQRGTIGRLEEKLQENADVAAKLQAELIAVSEQAKVASEALEKSKEDYRNLDKKYEVETTSLKSRLESNEQVLAEKDAKVTKLEGDLGSMKQNNNSLRQMIQTVNTQNEVLKSAQLNNEEALKTCCEEKSSLKEQIEEGQQRCTLVMEEINDLKIKFSAEETKMKDLLAQIEALKSNLEEKEARLQATMSEIGELKGAMKGLKALLETKDIALNEKNDEVKELKSAMEKQELKHKEEMDKLRADLQIKANEKVTLNQSVQKLKDVLSQRDEELVIHKEEMKKKGESIINTGSKLSAVSAENVKLKEEVATLNEAIETHNTNEKTSREVLDKQKAINEDLRKKLAESKIQIEKETNRVKGLAERFAKEEMHTMEKIEVDLIVAEVKATHDEVVKKKDEKIAELKAEMEKRYEESMARMGKEFGAELDEGGGSLPNTKKKRISVVSKGSKAASTTSKTSRSSSKGKDKDTDPWKHDSQDELDAVSEIESGNDYR